MPDIGVKYIFIHTLNFDRRPKMVNQESELILLDYISFLDHTHNLFKIPESFPRGTQLSTTQCL